MLEYLGLLFDTSDFPARWRCGHWSTIHGWWHIISDLLVFSAYTAIPLALAYFIRRRRDMPFPRIFWLFCAFIFACGTTHLIEASIFWWPAYRFSGLLKALTAVVSWCTVLSLIPILPKALALPGLARINAELEREVRERLFAEKALKHKAEELAEINSELERFSRLAIGHEDRIIELKNEVNELTARLGEPSRYSGVYDGTV